MFVAAGWQFNKYKSLVKSNWNELSQCSRFILYDYLKQYDHKIKLIFRVTNNYTKSLNTKNNYKAQNNACVCVCVCVSHTHWDGHEPTTSPSTEHLQGMDMPIELELIGTSSTNCFATWCLQQIMSQSKTW